MAADETILAGFKENNLDAFYRCIYPSLLLFAADRLSPNYAFLAEDCVQDAIFSTYGRRHDFHSFHAFMSYLYTCIRNKALSLLRKEKSTGRYIAEYKEALEGDLAMEIEGRETIREIFNLVNSLPEAYRRTFELSFVEGLSNADVAKALNLSVSSVKARKAGIRLKIKEGMDGSLPKVIAGLLFIAYYLVS